MDNITLAQKIARLRGGAKPRVLDLFAGCGGLSLGFEAAGGHVSGAVEFDKDAARSHGLNFHGGDPVHSEPVDITAVRPAELAKRLGLGDVRHAVDVVVGGPPCQAFARVGRPKLRQVDEHPEAFIHDPRARLYVKYLEYVDAFAPLAVVMENVPDALNHGGRNIAEETCEVLRRRGYVCKYTLLNAAFYGVPQMRERMFLIGYRKELEAEVTFPSPTHWLQLPPGYEGSRAVALKTLRSLANDAHSYVDPPVATPSLQPAVTAEDAIGDLPPIDARRLVKAGLLRRGARRFDERVPYDRSRAASRYAIEMRNWLGHNASDDGLADHVIRYLPRDFSLFEQMKPGEQYPEAHARATKMFEKELRRRRASGAKLLEGTDEYEELLASIVPPYDPGKFPNKWRKMWPDQPARTLMAHLGKDSYSHIHYDSGQARTISVREAARLQSFPDGFVFSGTMNPAFRQIGNAVPPLLAKAIAVEVVRVLREAAADQQTLRMRAAA